MRIDNLLFLVVFLLILTLCLILKLFGIDIQLILLSLIAIFLGVYFTHIIERWENEDKKIR
jgi:membrane protein implicated in regulation of membrane protease activity